MKIYIETLGCPKNFNDSELAAGILEKAGYRVAESPCDSDAIMVNTCGFINDAKKESIERIFDMAQVCGNEKILIVSGCLSQRYQEELYEEMPEVDLFIGVNDYENLPELLKKAEKGKRQKKYSGDYCSFPEAALRKIGKNPYTATLKIAEGCDNVCAYCVIPSIRGGYRSRKMEDILAEAELLARAGTKELILIAQDVTYYGSDIYGEMALPRLLEKLCAVPGIRWIRLMYCYEDRITDQLIETMASQEKICNYIDMPVQHASDKILKEMNRRSTNASIISTIKRLRRAMPDIHIRTTLITGFPGEGTNEFEELYSFVEETAFERLGVFAYSREEGTPADKMKGQVRRDVKQKRLDSIMRLQTEISLKNNKDKIGSVQEVIVEGRDEDGSYFGRSRYDAPEIDNGVLFTSNKDLQAGDIIKVRITDAFDYDLVGEKEN